MYLAERLEKHYYRPSSIVEDRVMFRAGLPKPAEAPLAVNPDLGKILKFRIPYMRVMGIPVYEEDLPPLKSVVLFDGKNTVTPSMNAAKEARDYILCSWDK